MLETSETLTVSRPKKHKMRWTGRGGMILKNNYGFLHSAALRSE